jgi:hypothetical protein
MFTKHIQFHRSRDVRDHDFWSRWRHGHELPSHDHGHELPSHDHGHELPSHDHGHDHGDLFVYSKSEYTLKSVSVSGRPSGRLHDNFRTDDPIVTKFSTQMYLIKVSVEFEDEQNSSRIYWVITKNVIIH